MLRYSATSSCRVCFAMLFGRPASAAISSLIPTTSAHHDRRITERTRAGTSPIALRFPGDVLPLPQPLISESQITSGHSRPQPSDIFAQRKGISLLLHAITVSYESAVVPAAVIVCRN